MCTFQNIILIVWIACYRFSSYFLLINISCNSNRKSLRIVMKVSNILVPKRFKQISAGVLQLLITEVLLFYFTIRMKLQTRININVRNFRKRQLRCLRLFRDRTITDYTTYRCASIFLSISFTQLGCQTGNLILFLYLFLLFANFGRICKSE